MSDKWFKYTFVCLECEAIYEISSKSASLPNCFDPICADMYCPGLLHLMSVAPATIQPNERVTNG